MATSSDKTVSERVGLDINEARSIADKCRNVLRIFEKSVEVIDAIQERDNIVPGLDNKIQVLKSEITKKKNTIDGLDSKISDREKKSASLDADILSKEEKVNSLNKYLEGEYASYETEKKKEIDDRMGNIEEAKKKEIKILTEKIDVLKRECSHVESRLNSAKSERDSLLKTLSM